MMLWSPAGMNTGLEGWRKEFWLYPQKLGGSESDHPVAIGADTTVCDYKTAFDCIKQALESPLPLLGLEKPHQPRCSVVGEGSA